MTIINSLERLRKLRWIRKWMINYASNWCNHILESVVQKREKVVKRLALLSYGCARELSAAAAKRCFTQFLSHQPSEIPIILLDDSKLAILHAFKARSFRTLRIKFKLIAFIAWVDYYNDYGIHSDRQMLCSMSDVHSSSLVSHRRLVQS
ncbi:hypothetical protein BY996DRAFT_6452075 [Phakopsora pachyrhizi]|nr:hypothetical protein BY996DRAFT_6452075 [Phakopsora pachyrhizi]